MGAEGEALVDNFMLEFRDLKAEAGESQEPEVFNHRADLRRVRARGLQGVGVGLGRIEDGHEEEDEEGVSASGG